jgi:glycine cleavage system pyridoxal-binding protein P
MVHPYIPNSVPEIQEEMLAEIGAASIDELYEDIPESLRYRGQMNLPQPGRARRTSASWAAAAGSTMSRPSAMKSRAGPSS